jgi:thymidylate synthase (FAD)
MKIIEQYHEILELSDLKLLEIAGRNCYKSEDKITEDSAPKFAKMIKERKHGAILEFSNLTVRFITNRSVTHEMVRHRIGMSYAQESTRYVRYNGEMEFIRPVWLENEIKEVPVIIDYEEGKKLKQSHNGSFKCGNLEVTTGELWCWLSVLRQCENQYKNLLDQGWRPEQAREVLPNSTKTEIIVKGNFRSWLHFFNLRCSKKAHPQIRHLAIGLLQELEEKVPVIFNDLSFK